MSYWDTQEGLINELNQDWTTAVYCNGEAYKQYELAKVYLALPHTLENLYIAAYKIIGVIDYYDQVHRKQLRTAAGRTPVVDLIYFLQNYCGVSAKSICEAWAKDNFKDRALTIAFIDRQRELLWNEPFNIQWAARPEESY